MKKMNLLTLSHQYQMDKTHVLGKGSTGEVYLGKQLVSNQPVAIKLIRLETIDNQVTEYLLKMEKIALTSISHENVLKGHKIIENSSKCYMVTQYCNGGTLKQLIRKQGALPQQKSIEIIKAVLKGYNALVRRKIVHRDLKPANIMFHNNVPKIIDFGYCQIEGHEKPSLEYNVGSPSYMAPESFEQNIYNEKTEIWAIGIILYECLMGKTFDDGKHMSQIFKALKKYGIPFGKQVSEKCRKIISWCLQFNPEKRPTALELINSLTQKKPNEPEFFILDKTRKKSSTLYVNSFQSANMLNKKKGITGAVQKKISSALQPAVQKKVQNTQFESIKRKISIKQYPKSILEQPQRQTQRLKSRSNSKSRQKYGFVSKNPVLRKTQNIQQFQTLRQRGNSNYLVKNEYGLTNNQNNYEPIFKTQKYFTGQNVQNKMLSAHHPVSAFNSGLTSPRQMVKNSSLAQELNKLGQKNPQSTKTRVISKQSTVSPLNDNAYIDEKYPSYSTYRPSVSQHEDNYAAMKLRDTQIYSQKMQNSKLPLKKQNTLHFSTGQNGNKPYSNHMNPSTLTTRHMSHYYPSNAGQKYHNPKPTNILNHNQNYMISSTNRERPASSIYELNRYLQQKQKPISIFSSFKAGQIGQKTCR